MADKLEAAGFERIKGPVHADTAWHISLPGDYTASMSEIESFEQDKMHWYLWQVPESLEACRDQGTGCPPWDLID